MTQQLSISSLGLNLIKNYETFHAQAQHTPPFGYIIGYNHSTNIENQQILSKSEATDILKQDIVAIEQIICTHVKTCLNQYQFDALCSLIFNIGETAFLNSDLLQALNTDKMFDAAHEFDHWCKAVIDGDIHIIDTLVRRRALEKYLFLCTPADQHISPLLDIIQFSEKPALIQNPYKETNIFITTPPEDVQQSSLDLPDSIDTIALRLQALTQNQGYEAHSGISLEVTQKESTVTASLSETSQNLQIRKVTLSLLALLGITLFLTSISFIINSGLEANYYTSLSALCIGATICLSSLYYLVKTYIHH